MESKNMEFMPNKDFYSSLELLWEKLATEGEIVLTNKGKPTAIVIKINDGLEEAIDLIRQVKAMRALNSMRTKAAAEGFMSGEEIQTEIKAAREEINA